MAPAPGLTGATTSRGRSRAERPHRPRGPRERSRRQLVQLALVRVLVVAPADELGAVADAVPGDVVEVHLDDQLRSQALPHQLLIGLPAAPLAPAALAGPVRAEP